MTTPPLDRALELTDFWTPLLLRMAVANGVVAAFGREERSADDVAVETGTDPGALARILRTLASRGVFEDAGDGRYRLTSAGRRFLPDEPGTIAGIANFKPWELHAWPRRSTRCERRAVVPVVLRPGVLGLAGGTPAGGGQVQ